MMESLNQRNKAWNTHTPRHIQRNRHREPEHRINLQIKAQEVRVIFEEEDIGLSSGTNGAIGTIGSELSPKGTNTNHGTEGVLPIEGNDSLTEAKPDNKNVPPKGKHVKTRSVVMSLSQALKEANKRNQDLIEINGKASPPICKIMEYGKFIYREQKSHKKDKSTKCKEIGFHVNIADHDFQTKMRQAKNFLLENHPLIFKIQFRGRECAHQEIGISLFNKVVEFLAEVGKQDSAPKINGKVAILRLSPLGKK
jgi:translation initiation factor IF-3